MKIEILKTGQKFAVALHIGCQGNIWLLICSLIENMQVRHKIIVDGQVKVCSLSSGRGRQNIVATINGISLSLSLWVCMCVASP